MYDLLVATKKVGTPSCDGVNYSMEAVLKIVSEEYHTKFFSGKTYWVGRIPNNSGDASAMNKFYKAVPMLRIGKVEPQDVDKEVKIYESFLPKGAEMGNVALMRLMMVTGIEYEIVPYKALH